MLDIADKMVVSDWYIGPLGVELNSRLINTIILYDDISISFTWIWHKTKFFLTYKHHSNFSKINGNKSIQDNIKETGKEQKNKEEYHLIKYKLLKICMPFNVELSFTI